MTRCSSAGGFVTVALLAKLKELATQAGGMNNLKALVELLAG